ncbi:MAG: bifunctional helix-turn-helix domain-containing protein/methylated-DNA--[protein]-cysteine S-methyltransferase, partial [Hyphomicrobiales bacterium]|nr:bifunctional helix-turn-helix domain-containing protein/methylated-DNA--[protein]-cysteine S-methyltransferase [Hyphomicrobiales bacterium]
LADYARVRDAIEYALGEPARRPDSDALAAHVGLTPPRLRALFRRYAGLTPQDFLQAVTIDRARAMLRGGASLLDAALDLGLSGPGRLHDLFVAHEAMSPGEWKRGGEGLALRHGFHPTPFGEGIFVVAPRGLAGLGFVEAGDRAAALADMRARWPRASFAEDAAATRPYATRVFDPASWRADRPLRVVLIGSDFEIAVWERLLRVPMGRAVAYSDIAANVGKPKAARAVGAAVGRNPISFVVPCHRALGKTGALTGYHWGLTRKRAILGWEAGRLAS